MKDKKETFKSLMDSFAYYYDRQSVFQDFLTMTMCVACPNPITGKSHYEDQYMQTIAKYAKDDLRHQFPKMFHRLTTEMEERYTDPQGNDVLGEYYEQNFCKKGSGQFFTPMHICHFMALSICGDSKELKEPKRVLDPTCGSGRMLLASAHCMGMQHEFYGIDIDPRCVKMAALNLFFNGIFHSEVMCANALSPDDFRISYVISLLPFGIFHIREKEKSPLWTAYKNTFHQKQTAPKPEIILPSEGKTQTGIGSQLQLF